MRVALLLRIDVLWLMKDIAMELKKKKNAYIYLYVRSQDTVAKFQHYIQEGICDEIIDIGDTYNNIFIESSFDELEVITEARKTEKFLGCTYNNISMSYRDIGRGFNLTGLRHPETRIEDKLTHIGMVNGFNKLFSFWEKELSEKKINLFINGRREHYAICKAMGIPYRFVFSARYKNRWYWSKHATMEIPSLEESYRKIQPDADLLNDEIKPYYQDVQQKNKIYVDSSLVRFLKLVKGLIKKELYLHYKGLHTPSSYKVSTMLMTYWRQVYSVRKHMPPFAKSLEHYKGKEFAFYAMQTEPEMSIQWMSPEYFCQLAAISSIARDLPAGMPLVVKDNIYSLGRRPKNFFKNLRLFKNVDIMSVKEWGPDVISASTITFTISGTVGIEAAMMGRPVISFGRHNQYDKFMPNVRFVEKEEHLKIAIDDLLLKHSIEAEEWKIAGRRYQQAIIDTTFDMEKHTESDRLNYSKKVVENATIALLEGL